MYNDEKIAIQNSKQNPGKDFYLIIDNSYILDAIGYWCGSEFLDCYYFPVLGKVMHENTDCFPVEYITRHHVIKVLIDRLEHYTNRDSNRIQQLKTEYQMLRNNFNGIDG